MEVFKVREVATEVCCQSNETLDPVGRRSSGYFVRQALEIRCRLGAGSLNSLRTAGLLDLAFLIALATHLRISVDEKN